MKSDEMQPKLKFGCITSQVMVINMRSLPFKFQGDSVLLFLAKKNRKIKKRREGEKSMSVHEDFS